MIKARESIRFSILFIIMMAGVWMYQKDINRFVQKEKNVPVSIKKFFKKKKNLKPHEMLLLLMGSYTAYFIVRRISTKYEMDPSALTVTHGIIDRRRDPVEMVKITDITVKTNPLIGIFGLSNVDISCPRDESHKTGLKMRFLTNTKALEIEKHIKDHATSTMTELFKAKQTAALERASKPEKKIRKKTVDLEQRVAIPYEEGEANLPEDESDSGDE